MILRYLSTIFALLIFTSSTIAQNEDILCETWCKNAYIEFQSQFGQGDCVFVIHLTPQNNVIFTGWCNYLFEIIRSKTKTFSPSGVLLESLYSPNGWVESSYSSYYDTELFHSLSDVYPICETNYECDTEVEMIQGVECILPRVVSTGEILYPSEYGNGVSILPEVVGAKALIAYNPHSGGISFCQQGTPVIINCTTEIPPTDTNIIDCTSFEEYTLGNIVPQGSPKFSLLNNVSSQNATISTTYSSVGSKSLKISNTTNLDYNIDRTLNDKSLARIDFSFYIPKGKAGVWSVETNNSNIYSVQLVCQNGIGKLYVKETVNGVEKLVEKVTINYLFDKWVPVAIIFQPFENEMEVWVSREIQNKSVYRSNLIGDLNFSGLTNASNTEMYIDELCYSEWTKANECTLEYDPLFINTVLYTNECVAHNDGYSLAEASKGECLGVGCPQLIYPVNGAINVPTSLTIQWEKDIHAIVYYLKVGTSEGDDDILNEKILDPVTSYKLNNLPEGKEIFVTIEPDNSVAGVSCRSGSFHTKSNIQLPSCSDITYPVNNELNVPTTINITWQSVQNATGYRLLLGTSAGNNDILDKIVGNVTAYTIQNLPADKNICATIIPYNSAGENVNCRSICFKTQTDIQLPSCISLTSPFNNEQNVPTTINMVWPTSAGANGYKIKLGTNNFSSDILPLTDVGNVTNFIVNNLPLNKFICATIVPYNTAGEVTNCSNTCFKTSTISSTKNDLLSTVMIYPNPTNESITIQGFTKGYYTIKDITGKLIVSQKSITENISIASLPSGLYFLMLSNNEDTLIVKIQKL